MESLMNSSHASLSSSMVTPAKLRSNAIDSCKTDRFARDSLRRAASSTLDNKSKDDSFCSVDENQKDEVTDEYDFQFVFLCVSFQSLNDNDGGVGIWRNGRSRGGKRQSEKHERSARPIDFMRMKLSWGVRFLIVLYVGFQKLTRVNVSDNLKTGLETCFFS